MKDDMLPLRPFRQFVPFFLCGILMICGGCAFTSKTSQPSASTPKPPAAPTKKKFNILYEITHPLSRLHLFSHKPAPPKAVPLRNIGTIRTLSKDRSYVIVELEPGVLIAPGTELLVIGAGGKPAHLKASDIQPPYFIADIVTGNPEPGDPVQQ